MIPSNINWNYPTTIWFGKGRIKEIEPACKFLKIKKPFFVTDANLLNLDFIKKILFSLKNVTCYSQIQGNPTEENVFQGIKKYKQENCDGVIAVGGGSAIDAGKAISLLSHQNTPIWELENIGKNWEKANSDLIDPIIAVPTTAGTGSEVSRASVITNTKTKEKKIIFHPKIMPTLVISDPETTLELPPKITAWTGMDAFTHSVEALCSPNYHPMAEGIAMESCRIIKENLPLTFKQRSNLKARSEMLVASSMGGTAFQKGLGSVHSLSHPLGAIYHSHHGLLNAIILPYALKQNQEAIENKMKKLCVYLDIKKASVDNFIQFLKNFYQTLEIPTCLKSINIGTEQAKEIAKKAFIDPSTETNAKALKTKDLQILFESAVNGNFESL